MQPGMNLLYPTPVQYTTMQNESICQQLVDALMVNVNLAEPTKEKLGENLLDLDLPEIAEWVQHEVYPAFDQYLFATTGRHISDFYGYKFKSWLTGTQGNYHLILHNHSGSHYSGVFYLLAEESTQGGQLVFSDPRSNANRGYDFGREQFDYTHIQPRTGDVYIFPSFLYHFVMPYAGTLRLCVPVDLYLFDEA